MSDAKASSNGNSRQWDSVFTKSSLPRRIAAHVDDWTPLPSAEATWLTQTAIPAGWHTILIADGNRTPLRVVATTVEGHSNWTGAQALSAFRFTGTPDPRLLTDHADEALRERQAQGIRTSEIVLPKIPDVAGARSSGYITVNDQKFWVRYHTYLRGSRHTNQGLLVEEIFAVATEQLALVGEAIGALADSAEDAFTAHIGATDDDVTTAVADHAAQLKCEATARPILTETQEQFLATALAMFTGVASHRPVPVEALGYTSRSDFDTDVARLRNRLVHDPQELSTLDWSRIQFLAEISWASDLFGAGVEFDLVSSYTDSEALSLLRSIQWALIRTVKPDLVFQTASPNAPSDIE